MNLSNYYLLATVSSYDYWTPSVAHYLKETVNTLTPNAIVEIEKIRGKKIDIILVRNSYCETEDYDYYWVMSENENYRTKNLLGFCKKWLVYFFDKSPDVMYVYFNMEK